MALKPMDNNWIKTSSYNFCGPQQQNLVLKVLHNLRSGIELFNKMSISGSNRRPSQQKASYSKLPELTKRNPGQISEAITSEPQVEANEQIQPFKNYGRMSSVIQQKSQIGLYNRLKTHQAKRSFGVSRYNWKKEKSSYVEMKGVVFKKKKPLVDQ